MRIFIVPGILAVLVAALMAVISIGEPYHPAYRPLLWITLLSFLVASFWIIFLVRLAREPRTNNADSIEPNAAEGRAVNGVVAIASAHDYPTVDSLRMYWSYSNGAHMAIVALFAGIFIWAVYDDFGSSLLHPYIAFALIALPIAATAVPLTVYLRRRKATVCSSALINAVMDRAQVGTAFCFGTPEEAEALQAVPAGPGEPIIVPRLQSPRGGGYELMFLGTCGLALFLTHFLHSYLWPLGYLLIIAADPLLKVLGLVIHQFRPVYYRISPGLLQLVRGAWMSDKVRVTRRIPLHEVYIGIRFDKQMLYLFDGQKQELDTINLNGLAEPHRLAEAIVWAVRTAQQPATPPLPDGALMG
jgi:hypothetical protein